SLMLRAAAPVLHREMFEVAESSGPAGILETKDLSPRQRDVLAGLLRGQSEKEVAYALGVSTHTVHTHVKRLYAELDVTSRGELLALFVDRKVLELTEDA
ncbi:MAG: helix-turn-helix transcriptional regulator, partial [Planctomycetota bacterium]